MQEEEKTLKPSSGDSVIENGTGGDGVMKGFIVAAYPGMGQEIYLSIYDDFKVLYLDEYDLTKPEDVTRYVNDAIRLVSGGGIKICFVMPQKQIIEELYKTQEPFLIIYPNIPKDKFLLRMFEMYDKPRSMYKDRFNKMIADVIKNYDKDIENLKLYFNSIASGNGIINEEVLKRFYEMQDLKKRRSVLMAIGTLKDMKASALKKSKKKKKRK